MRKDFFTPKFYEEPTATLNVLNELVKKNQVADMEMYQSGTFLFMEAYENEETKKMLADLILDLDAYKAYNNQCFVSDETTQIGLCALQDEHCNHFGRRYEIKWVTEQNVFAFAML